MPFVIKIMLLLIGFVTLALFFPREGNDRRWSVKAALVVTFNGALMGIALGLLDDEWPWWGQVGGTLTIGGVTGLISLLLGKALGLRWGAKSTAP